MSAGEVRNCLQNYFNDKSTCWNICTSCNKPAK